MKHNLFSAVLLLVLVSALRMQSQTPSDSLAFAAAEWNWQDIGKGAKAGYAQINMFGRVQSISVVRYSSRNLRTSIVHSPGEASNTTDSLAIENGAIIAINGSYFDMKLLYPHTYFCWKHKLISESPEKEVYRSNGVLARRHKYSREVEIFQYDASQTEVWRKQYYEAIASGPILVLDGVTPAFPMERSFYHMHHPRSFIGIKDDMIFLVVIDGRFPGQGEGASIPETAAIARWLGCKTALNLDGGGSSTLWTKMTGVLNHPYDNHTFDHKGCRKVPNIIIAR